MSRTYLKDELPSEFFNGGYLTVMPRNWTGQPDKPSPAAELLEVPVLREHSRVSDHESYREWPGPQQDVHCWWELENGKAVAWNENPSKGWSFPVITLNKLKVWNGRGDYQQFNGRFYVCAETKKRAVELIKQAGHRFMNMHEFTEYYSPLWGNVMEGVKREEGVWFADKTDEHSNVQPTRIL